MHLEHIQHPRGESPICNIYLWFTIVCCTINCRETIFSNLWPQKPNQEKGEGGPLPPVPVQEVVDYSKLIEELKKQIADHENVTLVLKKKMDPPSFFFRMFPGISCWVRFWSFYIAETCWLEDLLLSSLNGPFKHQFSFYLFLLVGCCVLVGTPKWKCRVSEGFNGRTHSTECGERISRLNKKETKESPIVFNVQQSFFLIIKTHQHFDFG